MLKLYTRAYIKPVTFVFTNLNNLVKLTLQRSQKRVKIVLD